MDTLDYVNLCVPHAWCIVLCFSIGTRMTDHSLRTDSNTESLHWESNEALTPVLEFRELAPPGKEERQFRRTFKAVWSLLIHADSRRVLIAAWTASIAPQDAGTQSISWK